MLETGDSISFTQLRVLHKAMNLSVLKTAFCLDMNPALDELMALIKEWNSYYLQILLAICSTENI